MIKKILVTALIFCFFNARGQNLSKSAVVEDLNILVNSITKYNSALKTYNPDFQSKTNKIITNVSSDLSLIDHFKKISEICALSN